MSYNVSFLSNLGIGIFIYEGKQDAEFINIFLERL